MKYLYTLVFFLGLTTLTFSQEIKYGIRVGTNISNMDYKIDGARPNPHRNGFVFGALVDFNINDSFSVMTELQYSAEGANVKDYKTDYLNLPIIANYQILDNFKIGIGQQIGLKIHKYNDGFKNFVFSAVGFAEYMLDDEFAIDFRYLYGVSQVYDNNIGVEARQGVMQFGVSYRL